MKLITAILKPYNRDDVRAAIGEAGVQGVTATEVRGFGQQRGHTEVCRGAGYAVEFVPKTELSRLFCLALLILPASAVWADGPAPTEPMLVGFDKINAGDTAWMLASVALVLLMTIPGLEDDEREGLGISLHGERIE
jgi:hypothetical protein